MIENKSFSKRDICTKFILPALTRVGWDVQSQIREEVSFTAGKIIVQGSVHTRGKQKRIVEKVNQLMQQCNELEQQVQQSRNHAAQLMQAVLRELFENKKEEVEDVV